MLLTHHTPDGVRRSRQQSLELYGVADGAAGAGVVEAFTEIARLARAFVHAEVATVNLLPAGRQVVVASTDAAVPGEFAEADSICSVLLEQRPVGTVVIPDLAEDPRFAANPFVAVAAEQRAVRGFASAPMIGHERVAVGTVCVWWSTPRTLRRDEASLLDQLARAAVKVLDDARHQTRRFPARAVRAVPAA